MHQIYCQWRNSSSTAFTFVLYSSTLESSGGGCGGGECGGCGGCGGGCD